MIKKYFFQIFIVLITVLLLVASSILSYYRWILGDGQYWDIFMHYIPMTFGCLSLFLFAELYVKKIRKTYGLDKYKLALWYLPMTFSLYFIVTRNYVFTNYVTNTTSAIFGMTTIFIVMILISIIFYRLRNRIFSLPLWIVYFVCYFLSSAAFYFISYLLSIGAGIGSLN